MRILIATSVFLLLGGLAAAQQPAQPPTPADKASYMSGNGTTLQGK